MHYNQARKISKWMFCSSLVPFKKDHQAQTSHENAQIFFLINSLKNCILSITNIFELSLNYSFRQYKKLARAQKLLENPKLFK